MTTSNVGQTKINQHDKTLAGYYGKWRAREEERQKHATRDKILHLSLVSVFLIFLIGVSTFGMVVFCDHWQSQTPTPPTTAAEKIKVASSSARPVVEKQQKEEQIVTDIERDTTNFDRFEVEPIPSFEEWLQENGTNIDSAIENQPTPTPTPSPQPKRDLDIIILVNATPTPEPIITFEPLNIPSTQPINVPTEEEIAFQQKVDECIELVNNSPWSSAANREARANKCRQCGCSSCDGNRCRLEE